MMLRKLQAAGGSPSSFAPSSLFARDNAKSRDNARFKDPHPNTQGNALLYSGVTLGLLASAAISVYWWKQRERALNLLQTTPFERAEELISSCEHKIEDIERAIEELKQAAR